MFLLCHSDMVNYSLELPPRNRLHKSKKPLSTYMYEDVHYFNRNILFTFFSFYCVFNAACFIIDFTSLLLKCLWLFCRNIYRSIRKGLVHRLKMRKTVAFPMAIVKKKIRQLQPHFLMVGEESESSGYSSWALPIRLETWPMHLGWIFTSAPTTFIKFNSNVKHDWKAKSWHVYSSREQIQLVSAKPLF